MYTEYVFLSFLKGKQETIRAGTAKYHIKKMVMKKKRMVYLFFILSIVLFLCYGEPCYFLLA